jgi:hypothetical protein
MTPPGFNSIGKDHLGALICIVLGAVVVGMGLTYDVGSLQRMGAGFVPVTVGGLLVLVGIAIGVTAVPRSHPVTIVGARGGKAKRGPEWRGWSCIIGGIVAFVVLGNYGGLVPASFFSVFIAALGDRNNTVKSSAILATIVTLFGVIVFYYLLSLQLRLFQWG